MRDWLRRRFASPQVTSRLQRHLDETLVVEVRKHKVVYLKPLAWLTLGVLALVPVPWALQAGWLLIIVSAALLSYGTWRYLQQYNDRFVVTNLRVFRVTGVFDQQAASTPLRRVLDVTVRKPLLGRMLGYGHFVFESAAQEQGLREISYVPEPDVLEQQIQDQVLRTVMPKRASATPFD